MAERSTPSRGWLWAGGLVGAALALVGGVALAWWLFYRPMVDVTVLAPPPPPAPPAKKPDAAALAALDSALEKQQRLNKQLEDQIAALKDKLRGDVCTSPELAPGARPSLPGGPAPSTPAPQGAPKERGG